jgi:VanZ family protein
MFPKVTAVLAWAFLAFIVFATIFPLQYRPTLFNSADLEHIGAFAVLGGLFCSAYPRHIILVCFIVLGSAVLLEYLQTLTPDRHGTLLDASEKIVGGALSIFAATAALYFRHRKRSSQSQT